MQKSTFEKTFHLNLYVYQFTLFPTVLNFIMSSFLVYAQEEISGWREDLFTARKSAMNLLGVISLSKVCT